MIYLSRKEIQMDRKKYIEQASVLKAKRLRRIQGTLIPPTIKNGVVKIEPIPKSISLPKHTKIFSDRPTRQQTPKKGCQGCRRNK